MTERAFSVLIWVTTALLMGGMGILIGYAFGHDRVSAVMGGFAGVLVSIETIDQVNREEKRERR